MCVLHWFLKYPHLSRVVSCLCLWRIQSLKGTKWVLNPFQKPIYYKQELTQGLQLCVISVQSLSRVRLFVTPLTAAHQASLFHHQLPEFTQTHVHWVGDAIQPSHPLSSPYPALNLSQRQGLFQWVSSSHQVTKVLEFQLQHQSFQSTFRTDFL